MTNSIKKRIADTFPLIAMGAMIFVIFVGIVYLSVSRQIEDYNKFITCNPRSNLSRIEWFLGFRPYQKNECWH
jgi:hypothetical protein